MSIRSRAYAARIAVAFVAVLSAPLTGVSAQLPSEASTHALGSSTARAAQSAPTEQAPPGEAAPPRTLPNIIFILTDDQRWDSVPGVAPESIPQDIMPNLGTELMQNGVVFTEAFITCPLCGPARASFFSGGFYAHHTGVLYNSGPNGGADKFHDEQTLATLLQQKGYKTAFSGKYVNSYWLLDGYDGEGDYIPSERYVPPGWDVWLAMTAMSSYQGQRVVLGASSASSPERGRLLPHDIRLPHDISEFEQFLDDLEADGFPPSVSDYLRGRYCGPSDYNHDGDVDYDDLLEQLACLGGPGGPLASDCEVFDADLDNDVDLADFAAFQGDFGGVPYITEFQHEFATAFLADAPGFEEPFFLMLSVYAPHNPSYPAPQDTDLFPGFTYRGRSWGEEDLADKPWHVRDFAEPRFSNYYDGTSCITADCRPPDEYFADQLRCLRAVDRMIGDLVTTVDQDEQLRDNTVFIFASDNGEMWGEHRRFFKGKPYEESTRVPLVIKMPNMQATTVDGLVAVDLDVPATILNLAGYTEQEIQQIPLSDGRSLLPIMQDPGAEWRDHLLLHFFRRVKLEVGPTWAAIRTASHKYVLCDYFEEDATTLAEELYDLDTDPLELQSQHGNPDYAAIRDQLTALLEQERGLVITGLTHPYGNLALGYVGANYEYTLTPEGGTPPYTFSLYTEGEDPGVLPDGLELSTTGVISGVLTAMGTFDFDVKVEDCSVSPQHGGHQSYVVRLRIHVW